MSELDPIKWAKDEAARLRGLASHPGGLGRDVTARGRQFLAQHTARSAFDEGAQLAARASFTDRAILSTARQLEEWAAYQESGLAGVKPFEVLFRVEAATDLMEQVQELLRDREMHAAAPIVLAGAALEEFLRSGG